MAHLWIQETEQTRWVASPLTCSAYALSQDGLGPLENHDRAEENAQPPAMLVRCEYGVLERWFLLARNQAHIHVNGQAVVLGARLLCDRDEIAVRSDGASAMFHGFFSTERLPEVAAYPGGDQEVHCPRCKLLIDNGQMAVRCPNPSCGAWHHQEAARPCWTYSDTCAVCGRPTQLDAGYRWTPENL